MSGVVPFMHLLIVCCAAAQVKAPGCAAGGGGGAAVLVTDANSVSYGIGEADAGAGALPLAARTSVSAALGSFLNKCVSFTRAWASASAVASPLARMVRTRVVQSRSIAALRAATAAPSINAVDLMHFFLLWRLRASALRQPNFLPLANASDL